MNHSAESKNPCGWLALAMVLGLRPVANDDLWWQLARGSRWRSSECGAVCIDKTLEADWLGGLPLAAIFELGGVAGLMILKILAVVLFACGLNRDLKRRSVAHRMWWISAALLGTSQAWEPSPLLWEIAGIVAVWVTGRRWSEEATWRRAVGLIVVLIAWANLAPGVIVGTLIGSVWCLGRRPHQVAMTAAIWLASSLTPRGVGTLWDSLCCVLPRVAADGAVLMNSVWRPTLWAQWDVATGALCVLSVASVRVLWQVDRGREKFLWTVCVILGWSCSANVAPMAVALTLLGSALPAANWQNWLPQRRWAPAVVMAGLCLLMASGWTPAGSSRLGWGLSPRLDLTALRALPQARFGSGTAVGWDVRTMGMASWLQSCEQHWPAAVPEDIPQRALLGGRLRRWMLMRDDLIRGRSAPYLRDDGTSGGWWLECFPSPTTAAGESQPTRPRIRLLLVAAEDTELIRALEPSVWKPLSLDAPVIPYAFSGDAAFGPQLVTALKLREVSDRGHWLPDAPSAWGSDSHWDLWGTVTQAPDASASLRLARVLRAMQLPTAASKVLLACGPAATRGDLRRELMRCQWDLAQEEALFAGRSSRFSDPGGVLRHGPQWLSAKSPRATGDLWTEFVAHVPPTRDRQFKIDLMANEFANPENADERRYAAARNALLLGRPELAQEHWQALLSEHPQSALAPLARRELE